MHESVKGTQQFEGIGNRLAKMVRIPTVSGAGNEEFYQIGAYRALLEKEFSYLFQAAKKHPVGEALLLELQVEAEGPHHTLRAVVAPRKAPAVKTPDRAHLLLGLETPRTHAVSGDDAQRMLGPHLRSPA